MQASLQVSTRSLPFWDVTRHILVIYRRFGTAYRSHLKGQAVFFDRLKREDGTIICPETLVNNWQSAPRKIPEKRRSNLVNFKWIRISYLKFLSALIPDIWPRSIKSKVAHFSFFSGLIILYISWYFRNHKFLVCR